ncbi:hypothetical protein F5X96DRAFT_677451 [Biscogniauxia mediterranea]|nr:hypothetical protein F5X96DRAFT_677451 [Biscogniauxia mediterranea]
MASPSLHFDMPQSMQQFSMFAKFPYDIRYKIWDSIIFTPGIHFLKLVDTVDELDDHELYPWDRDSDGWPDSPSERLSPGKSASPSHFTAILKPLFPLAAADRSHYLTMSKTLNQLALSCNEAKHLIDKVVSRPGNLTLDNGRLIVLDKSSDIVCIDYPRMVYSRHLGKWADQLDLDQLSKIRRLAIRYTTEWDEESRICSTCGRIHSVRRRYGQPHHVYEFASLFKNLETFYFIDCFAVRKSSDESIPSSQVPQDQVERFATGEGERSYYEVDQRSCKMNTNVFTLLSWVQENYIAHCRRIPKSHSNPETVKFKVLGCEWNTDQQLVPVKYQETQALPARKKRSRAQAPDLPRTLRNPVEDDVSRGVPMSLETLPVVFGDGAKSKFEFTMEVPH